MAKEELLPQHCFICNGTKFWDFLRLNDYFFSQEEFTLSKCITCGLLYTMPQPDAISLHKYYNSEEYTSHNTSHRSLKNLLYIQARKVSLSLKLRMIQKHQEAKGQILDIGAGTGEFLNYCRAYDWNIIGVEPNAKARKIAYERHEIVLQNEADLSILEKGSTDVITMWHVLEHITDPLSQLETNYQLLNKSGLLVLALPNYESWDANKYGRFWAAYDVPRHLYHFTKKSVSMLAEKSGFRVVEINPMKFDSFYICLLSEKYMHGKMNYIKAFVNGLRSNRLAQKEKFGYSSLVYLLKKK